MSPDVTSYILEFYCAFHAGASANVAALLADERCEPDLADHSAETALHWAVDLGWLEVVKRLLAHPRVDPDRATRLGDTPLIRASSFCAGDARVVEALVFHTERPANLDAVNHAGHTALLLACHVGAADIVRLLLAAGADPDRADNLGSTPLLWAAYKGHLEVVCLLLAAHAKVNLPDFEGDTPIIVACSEGHASVLHALLQNPDLDPNHENYAGLTAYICACNESHFDCVNLLLTDPRLNCGCTQHTITLDCPHDHRNSNDNTSRGQDNAIDAVVRSTFSYTI